MMLDELSRFSGHHGHLRAQAVVEAADGGCENVFEATVLWIVKSLYAGRVLTQFPITIEDHTYFGDIVLPDLKVIIEPDGRTKFGDNEQEVRDNTGKWLARQHDLTNAGWRVVRVRWQDTENLVTFRTGIAAQLRIEHLPITQQSLRLWAEPRQPHAPRSKQRTHR